MASLRCRFVTLPVDQVLAQDGEGLARAMNAVSPDCSSHAIRSRVGGDVALTAVSENPSTPVNDNRKLHTLWKPCFTSAMGVRSPVPVVLRQKVHPALIARFRLAMVGCFWPIFFFADYNEAWHTLAGVCIPSLNASLALPV